MIWLLLAALATAAPCRLDAPEGAVPRTTDLRAEDVWLSIELWTADLSPERLEAAAAVLESRQLRAALVTREDVSAELRPVLTALTERGHELVLEGAVPRFEHRDDAQTSDWRRLKKQARSLERAVGVRPRAFAGTIPGRVAEAVVTAGGFPVMLPDDRAPGAVHAQSGRFEGTIAPPVTLPLGPYPAAVCGGTPHVAGFNAATANRVTAALAAATGTTAAPVVRVALHELGPADLETLGRWLDDVVLPAGIQVGPPSTIRAALVAIDEGAAVSSGPGGRRVPVEEIRGAAAILVRSNPVPRTLPGNLNPTEAFMALLVLAAEDPDPTAIRIQAMQPPDQLARTTLTGAVTVPRSDVEAFARSLLAAPPARLPNALPVGPYLLTTPEILVLLASTLVDETPTTRPTAVVEPNAPGLGWGVAGRGAP